MLPSQFYQQRVLLINILLYLWCMAKKMRIMDDPLTPDEDSVFSEFLRLDVEPNGIPVELFEGFLERLAASCNMSVQRARVATQGLIDKGKFDVVEERKDDRVQTDREIIIDLLLHDPEVRELLKKIVGEISPDKTT
jgi:hypothetical protein